MHSISSFNFQTELVLTQIWAKFGKKTDKIELNIILFVIFSRLSVITKICKVKATNTVHCAIIKLSFLVNKWPKITRKCHRFYKVN